MKIVLKSGPPESGTMIIARLKSCPMSARRLLKLSGVRRH